MSEKTILYTGEFSLPDKNAAAHRVLNNAKALRDIGYNVVFIDIDTQVDSSTKITSTKKNHQGFDCYSVPYPKAKLKWLQYLCSIDNQKIIVDKLNNLDTIICYNTPAIAMLKLKKLCRNNNIKIMCDCTEWHHSKGKSLLFDLVQNLNTALTMRWVNKRLDGLIVISSYLKRYFKKYTKLILVPPLVDISEEKWQITTRNDSNAITLVYSGSPGKNKDKLDKIIDMVSQSDSALHLKIVGIKKSDYLKIYPKEKQYTDFKNIEFLGRVEHIESLRILNSGDFAIFVRDDNRVSRAGFPTKFVESITCKVPVITNKTSDIDTYLIDGQNGFLLTDDRTLNDIFSLPFDDLKSMRNSVDNEIFDYRNYLHKFKELFDKHE